MENLNFLNKFNDFKYWLLKNKNLLIDLIINTINFIIIIFIGIIISNLISRLIKKAIKIKFDNTVADFTSSIAYYSVILLTIITSLHFINVPISPIIAILGTAGLTIGLSLQGALSNFASGILLVVLKHFRIGDYVDFSGISGTVVVIEIFSTTLRTNDGNILILPNNKIISSNITNFSKEHNQLIDIKISLDYDSDIEQIKKIIIKIFMCDNRIIKNKDIIVRLKSLNQCFLNFVIQAWVIQKDQKDTVFDLLENIKITLDTHKIKILCLQVNTNNFFSKN